MTALLISSSSRRSLSAGSASVAASARSNSGRASAIRPRAEVTAAISSSAQPMAQLSPASDRRRQRVGGDLARLLDLAEVAVRPRGEHEQPGPVPGRDPGRGQRPVQRGQGLRGLARQHAALRQRPVQVHQDIGLGGVLQRAVRHLLGRGPVADAVQGVGQPAGQPAVPGRAGRGAGHGPAEEFGRHRRAPGRPAGPRCGPASPASTHPPARPCRRVRAAGPQHLPGHPVGRRARLRQGAPGVAVPRGAHRRRHLVVQRRPDQRMPEPEAVPGLGQHAGRARLVHRRDQVRHAAAQHDRQVGDREIHAEQGRRPQHLPHRPGGEAEAIRDGRGQRIRRGTAGQLGRA